MSNLDKLLQGLDIYGIYMTFFQTRSGDFVGTPPRVKKIRGGARDYQSLQFRTFCHPELKFDDDLFYTVDEGFRRKKRVPEKMNIKADNSTRILVYRRWIIPDQKGKALLCFEYAIFPF